MGETNVGMTLPCTKCDLRGKAVFRPLTDRELADVAHLKGSEVSLPAKCDIVPSERIGDAPCTLKAGWAFSYRSLPNGTRQILDFLLPGDTMGLQKALTGGTQHRVHSLTPVTVCVLNGMPLPAFLDGHPEMCSALNRKLLMEQRRADERLTALGRLTAPQRIGYLMLDIFDRLRRLGLGDGAWVHFPLQRQHIADALGLSGTHVNRSLIELRERELVSLGNNVLFIHDREALEGFCCYVPLEIRDCVLLL